VVQRGGGARAASRQTKYRGVEQLGSSLGERAKTIEYRFCEVKPHEARNFRAERNEARK